MSARTVASKIIGGAQRHTEMRCRRAELQNNLQPCRLRDAQRWVDGD